jgi:SEC-C motif-containing protein
MDCHCGSGAAFAACCGPLLAGDARPETAEALMRSRYVAYVRRDVDYLVGTHDPATRRRGEREAVEQWMRIARWLGLEVLATSRGGPGDDVGEVEFRARYQAGGRMGAHHERSRFRRLDGRWVYVDGESVRATPAPPSPPVVRSEPKTGRNEPCPCGSGKKYKRCCGASA